MFEVMSLIALVGIFSFLAYYFAKCYEEAKKEGIVYDDSKEER